MKSGAKGYSFTSHQTESYDGNKIDARAAFSVEVSDKPIFGAMWLTSRVETDKDLRLVVFDQLTVEEVKFPEEDQSKLDTFQDDLNAIFKDVDLSLSFGPVFWPIRRIFSKDRK